MKASVITADGSPGFVFKGLDNLIVICGDDGGWKFGIWDVFSAKMPLVGGLAGTFGEVEIPLALVLAAHGIVRADSDRYADRLFATTVIQNWTGFFQNDVVFS